MEPSNFSSFGIPVGLRLELEALSESSESESSLKSDEKDDDEELLSCRSCLRFDFCFFDLLELELLLGATLAAAV